MPKTKRVRQIPNLVEEGHGRERKKSGEYPTNKVVPLRRSSTSSRPSFDLGRSRLRISGRGATPNELSIQTERHTHTLTRTHTHSMPALSLSHRHIHTHRHTRTHARTRTDTHAHTHAHAHTHTLSLTHTHTDMDTRTQTHTQTHTPTPFMPFQVSAYCFLLGVRSLSPHPSLSPCLDGCVCVRTKKKQKKNE